MEPMSDPHGPVVTVEAVEWLPSGGGSGLVRVRGRWRHDPEPEGLPVLVVGPSEWPHRHESLPDPRAGREPGVWRGAYIVRAELVEAGHALVLEVPGRGTVTLPAPSRGITALDVAAAPVPSRAAAVPASEGADVFDGAVIAERRARRAEAAEAAQARIAAEALKAVEVLELRGAELERRLAELVAERDELGGGESIEMLHERLAAAEGRALELRHEASAAREAGEAGEARVAEAQVAAAVQAEALRAEIAVQARLARDARVAREAIDAELRAAAEEVATARAALAARDEELRAALSTADDLRDLVRDWTVRMRASEIARTSDAVRLAVLESDHGAHRSDLDAAQDRLARARARVAELEQRPPHRDPVLDAERAVLATTLVELDDHRSAAEREARASAGLADALEAERAVIATLSADLESLRRSAAATDAALAAETEARQVAERLSAPAEAEARRLADELAIAVAEAGTRASDEAVAALEAQLAGLRTELEEAERGRRTLQRELDVARAAVDAAEAGRFDAEALRSLVAAGEVGSERLETELADLRAEIDVLTGARTAVEAERDAARDDVEALKALAQAAEQTRSAFEAELTQLRAAVRPASASLVDRVAEIERAPSAPPSDLASRAASLARLPAAAPAASPLLADLDRAAAELRARRPATAPTVTTPAGPPARGDATGSSARDYPWLRGALVKLAHDDPATAGRLIVGLLPAQAERLGPGVAVDYDLTVTGIGSHAVTVAAGAVAVAPLERPRGRRRADFRLEGSALALAELLAGHGRRPRRLGGPVRLKGRRRLRARELLTALAQDAPSLTGAARAGARLEPGDVFAAFPYAIHPSWTRGHTFTIAQEVVGHGTWLVGVADGAPLTVERGPAPDAPRPDAAVTFTRPAFDALLRAEPAPAGERPRVRGDRVAVALLKAWTDRALGA